MNPATLHICRCGHDRDDHQSRTEQEDGQKVQVEKCEHCPCRAYVRRLGPLDTLVETYRAAALPASQGTAPAPRTIQCPHCFRFVAQLPKSGYCEHCAAPADPALVTRLCDIQDAVRALEMTTPRFRARTIKTLDDAIAALSRPSPPKEPV
jgi:hypothetical protein